MYSPLPHLYPRHASSHFITPPAATPCRIPRRPFIPASASGPFSRKTKKFPFEPSPISGHSLGPSFCRAARDNESLIQQAREWLRAARNVVALTGAGISAESGVPTFRGPGGLWNNYRPEDLATPEAFHRDPLLVWQWYDWRRQLLLKAQPNAGHRALAAYPLTLITQNVDGLHQRAGSPCVIQLHGDIWTLRCLQCGKSIRDETAPLPSLPPRCPCGGMQRPGVVWFGEGLPQDEWRQADRAAMHCDVMLVIGTSALVYPAANLAPRAFRAGARVIEVNLEETPASREVHLSLRGKAGEILPELLG